MSPQARCRRIPFLNAAQSAGRRFPIGKYVGAKLPGNAGKRISMLYRHVLLLIPLAVLPATSAVAADATDAGETTAQKKEACKQQEQQEGKGDKTSDVICAVKVLFQSRIRRKKETEPVEMTVGSPPMHTDDTDTPGPNNWEINLGMEASWAGREHRIEAPVLDVNYGVGERLQFTYEVPFVFQAESEPAPGGDRRVNAQGVGDSSFGIKYRFYDNEDTGVSFAIDPQVEFRTPGANNDVSEGATSFVLPLSMTSEFEHASIGANIGVEATSRERRYFASVGIGARATDRTAVMAEIAGSDLNAADERRVLLNLGVRHKISETQGLSAALGHDLYAGGDQRDNTYVSLAYQKLFGE
jgi:hypothetical protein